MNYVADFAGEIKFKSLPGNSGEFAILELESEIFGAGLGACAFSFSALAENRDPSTPNEFALANSFSAQDDRRGNVCNLLGKNDLRDWKLRSL